MLERQSYYFSITLWHYVQSAHDSIRDSTLILSLKIAKGNFVGYHAIITETTENMQTITKQDEVKVNYLKKSFGSGL